jgi:pimeloyl-ACP methyl ester carboxylesterase
MPYLDVNGDPFHYELDDFADPWKPHGAVLFHHGAAGTLDRWRAWVPAMSRWRRVVRFDMRGYGGTPPPPGPKFSLPQLAADVAGVMDGLEIDKVHFVGASAGGIVGLRFAHDFPQRLSSLTLVTSTPKLSQTRMNAEVWQRVLKEQGIRAWLMSDAEKRFGPNVDPGLLDWYAEGGTKTTPEVVIALQDCLFGEDLTPLLPQIQAPTLVLAVRDDDITPMEVQRLMARRIPDARLKTFSGMGHQIEVEAPDLLARHVLRFMDRVDGAQS